MAEKEIKKIVESKLTAVATPSSSSSSGITKEKSKASTPPSAPATPETIVPVVESTALFLSFYVHYTPECNFTPSHIFEHTCS